MKALKIKICSWFLKQLFDYTPYAVIKEGFNHYLRCAEYEVNNDKIHNKELSSNIYIRR